MQFRDSDIDKYPRHFRGRDTILIPLFHKLYTYSAKSLLHNYIALALFQKSNRVGSLHALSICASTCILPHSEVDYHHKSDFQFTELISSEICLKLCVWWSILKPVEIFTSGLNTNRKIKKSVFAFQNLFHQDNFSRVQ